MNDATGQHTLNIEAKRLIDRVCLEFESAWKSSERPEIAQYLSTGHTKERSALFRELLLLDMEYRDRAAEPLAREEYHQRFPEYVELIDEASYISSKSRGGVPPGTKIRYLGDYELLDEIARGGMGIVYKARQISLNRVVALKLVLAGQFASAEEVERFHRESEAAANLQHPNIVAIYEVGEHEGHQYFSMAYIEGQRLAEVIRENPLPAVRAASYVQTVARAVEYAHQRGTLHRDLKPSNILIDMDDQPQITDFGLARRVDADSDLTKSGQILGSPSYMPPEQASGKHGDVGPRSDVYSLGAVLYELVTGRAPFRAESATDTLLHVMQCEPVPLRALNPRVPRDLETICLKCLDKQPQRRYPSAAELTEELGRFLTGQPIYARPVTPPGRVWRWCRRNPVVSALAVGLIVAVLAGLLGIAIQWDRAEDEARRANLIAQRESFQRRKAERAAEQNRRKLYVSDMNVAQQAWEAGNVERVMELLERHRPKPDQEDLRGFQWHCLSRQCQRSVDTTTLTHGGPVWGIAFSPDAKTLASVAFDSPVRLWDVETGLLGKSLGEPAYGSSLAFSPDGQTLVTGTHHERKRRVWDLTTGENTTTSGVGTVMFSMEFSPDGKLLGLADGAEVQLWDVAKGKRLRSHNRHSSMPIWRVAFSPTGEMLASIGNREVVLWDIESGDTNMFMDDLDCGSDVAFSADGKTLAAAGLSGKIWLWDVDSRQPIEPLQGESPGAIWSLAFASDGRLAAGSSGGTISLWDVNNRVEHDVLKGHQGGVWDLAFSPDDRVLASGSWDGNVRLWEFTVRGPPDVLRGHSLDVSAIAFLPDGSALASVSSDGTVRLWDVQTGEELGALKIHQNRIMSIAVSPDGQTLASGGWDYRVKLWDISAGQQRTPLGKWCAYGLAFSPDGRSLASCGASPSAEVWDVRNGSRRYGTTDGLLHPNGHRNMVAAVAISPSDAVLATGSWDKTVRLWDLTDGAALRSLEGHQGFVLSVAFSPDGNTLASGSADSTVRLWDATTGEPSQTFRTHSASVNSVAFSPDGAILASGSDDRTVKLVYLGADRDPESLATDAAVSSVAFSPDGSILAASSGKAVRLWRKAGADGIIELDFLTRLQRRARSIADANVEEQRQIIEDLRRHLAASAEQRLLHRDIILATSTARRMQDRGQRKVAANAFLCFSAAVRDSGDPRHAELANVWESVAHGALDRSD